MSELPIVAITYTDVGGNVTRRTVQIHSADEECFEAFCYSSQGPRTFRFDRVSEVATEAGEPIDRDTWVRSVVGADVPYRSPKKTRPTDDGLVTVVFTGLGKALKSTAEELAGRHGLRVIKSGSVTARLGFLVTGPTAGPSKLAKARELGVDVMSYEDFCRMVETGEVER